MLQSAAAKNYRRNYNLKRRPTNEHEWRIMNQVKQAPQLIQNRIASTELRRTFLEGQNVRNNESEKRRLQGMLDQSRYNALNRGRFQLRPRDAAALQARIAHIDENPANRDFNHMNPAFARPIIGAQPRYHFV